MRINSFPVHVLSFLQERVEYALTTQQRKIVFVATLILGCLAMIYLVKSWSESRVIKASLFTGHGNFTSPGGNIVDGEFKEGMLHGQGKVICKNGEIWEGEFKDNQMNGQGKKTCADGSIEEGIFKNGILT